MLCGIYGKNQVKFLGRNLHYSKIHSYFVFVSNQPILTKSRVKNQIVLENRKYQTLSKTKLIPTMKRLYTSLKGNTSLILFKKDERFNVCITNSYSMPVFRRPQLQAGINPSF